MISEFVSEFKEGPAFPKMFKKLCKKYPSLESDFETFKNAVAVGPPDNKYALGLERIQAGSSVKIPVFKAKKFHCSCLKNKGSKSGIRIIYGYDRENKRVTFTEIYKKNGRSNHNISLILACFSE